MPICCVSVPKKYHSQDPWYFTLSNYWIFLYSNKWALGWILQLWWLFYYWSLRTSWSMGLGNWKFAHLQQVGIQYKSTRQCFTGWRWRHMSRRIAWFWNKRCRVFHLWNLVSSYMLIASACLLDCKISSGYIHTFAKVITMSYYDFTSLYFFSVKEKNVIILVRPYHTSSIFSFSSRLSCFNISSVVYGCYWLIKYANISDIL